MRTVLVGSDFTFNKLGNLVPFEINTNIGWHTTKLEDDDDCIDLSVLSEFIINNGYTKVVYIGGVVSLLQKIKIMVEGHSIEFQGEYTSPQAITIPFIEDNETTLIIRSAYDATALVDDTYCRDKVNFLNLIKNETFGSQFAYRDDLNNLISNITIINDNGIHPNFILKSILPAYNKSEYPKLFRVTNQEELDVVLTNVDSTYFLMEYHFNENHLYNDNQIKMYRGLNLLFPPNLESISLGGYTLLSSTLLNDSPTTYDPTTFELSEVYRNKYLIYSRAIQQPKLLDTDLVQLADGTFVTALELQVGDDLKTIDVPNPNDINLTNETADFGITYNSLVSDSTYSTNKVLGKKRVNNMMSIYTEFTFTDATSWADTAGSFYLINREDNIRFVKLDYNPNIFNEYNIQIGDKIILIDTSSETLNFVSKEVATVTKNRQYFSGWLIDVERQHLFLTKTESTGNESFVSIEHNQEQCNGNSCTDGAMSCQQSSCDKGCYCIWDGGTLDEPCNDRGGGWPPGCFCSSMCLY
jgi:hypothetical protein